MEGRGECQFTLIPFFKRSNPKRGIQVTEYHVSWRQIKPPYSLEALMTGLEKAITQELDPVGGTMVHLTNPKYPRMSVVSGYLGSQKTSESYKDSPLFQS